MKKKSKGHLPHSSPWPSGGSSPQWSPDRWVGTRWPAWSDPDGAHGPWPAGPQSGSSRCRRISPAPNNIYFRDTDHNQKGRYGMDLLTKQRDMDPNQKGREAMDLQTKRRHGPQPEGKVRPGMGTDRKEKLKSREGNPPPPPPSKIKIYAT